jgi:hypothetical protein
MPLDRRLAVALLAALCGLLLLAPAAARAAGYTPTRTDDPPPDGCRPDDCSLREAVIAANAGGGFDFIQLGATRYTLTNSTPGGSTDAPTDGDLDVTDTSDLFLLGAGANQTVIDALGIDRGLDVAPGARLLVYSLQIRNGAARLDTRTGHWHGGAIHNHGYLGLFWSTLVGNLAGPAWGGGGLTNAGSGTADLSDDTISGNATSRCGGGIENGGTLKAFNVTLVANTAPPGRGPGVSNGTGSSGCFFSAGAARLNNTIIANNNDGNCAGTITSAGHNLATDTSCALSASTDVITGAPGLAPLLDGSGYVWLYRLLAGSPAIDRGGLRWDPATDTGCGPLDEAGTARPEDGNGDGLAVCDIGAHEYTPGFVRGNRFVALRRPDGRARLRVMALRRAGGALVVSGSTGRGRTGIVTAAVRAPGRRALVATGRAVVRRSRFSLRVPLRGRRATITLIYSGDAKARPAALKRALRP